MPAQVSEEANVPLPPFMTKNSLVISEPLNRENQKVICSAPLRASPNALFLPGTT